MSGYVDQVVPRAATGVSLLVHCELELLRYVFGLASNDESHRLCRLVSQGKPL